MERKGGEEKRGGVKVKQLSYYHHQEELTKC